MRHDIYFDNGRLCAVCLVFVIFLTKCFSKAILGAITSQWLTWSHVSSNDDAVCLLSIFCFVDLVRDRFQSPIRCALRNRRLFREYRRLIPSKMSDPLTYLGMQERGVLWTKGSLYDMNRLVMEPACAEVGEISLVHMGSER